MNRIFIVTIIYTLLSSCASTSEVVSYSSPAKRIDKSVTEVDLPPVNVISTFETAGFQMDIIHAFGNDEEKQIELHYRLKNWDAAQNYVINAKGNSISINNRNYSNNCVYLNGEEQCGEHFSSKVNAETDVMWYGKYIFKNIGELDVAIIDQIKLRFLDNQINGQSNYMIFKSVPIVWDANYISNQAKKTPKRMSDDNQGLVMEIQKATLNLSNRKLEVHYTITNHDGKSRSFYVNGRDNQLVYHNQVFETSCAGIEDEIECGIHFEKKKRLNPGASTTGVYVFKNVKSSNSEMVIDKLLLRYNENVLNSRPYFAVFGQVPVSLE